MPATPRRVASRRGRVLVAVVVAATVAFAGCSFSSRPEVSVTLPPTTTSSPTTSTEPVTPGPGTTNGDTGSSGDGSVVISPAEDASAIVDAAPEGTVFELLPGVHRGFSVRPKDGMSFVGAPGVVLNGAVVLSEPEATESGWLYAGVEQTGENRGECISGYSGCTYSQDLFFDDVMMWQVTDEGDLESGTWFWGRDGIHVVDDPANRRVELSVDVHAFIGSADDVTISDLTVEKYATPAQAGAIQAQEPGDGERGARWLVEDVEVRGVHGAGIRTGDETVVRRLHSHHNGQMGISVSGGTDVLIEDSELAFNNVAGFEWGWEAGGSKFSNTEGLVVRTTHAHDNHGPGLWTDIDNVDTVYVGNRVEDNDGPGIFHEISYDATIRDNVVVGNGFGFSRWLWGAGILIAASSNVEVYGNEVRDNANGIAGIQQDRGEGSRGPRLLANLSVHDNTIALGSGALGVVEDVRDPTVFTDRNITFNRNVYEGVTGASYRWDGRRLDRRQWQGLGFDVDSVWR